MMILWTVSNNDDPPGVLGGEVSLPALTSGRLVNWRWCGREKDLSLEVMLLLQWTGWLSWWL